MKKHSRQRMFYSLSELVLISLLSFGGSMKTCPVCQRLYSDEMIFVLQTVPGCDVKRNVDLNNVAIITSYQTCSDSACSHDACATTVNRSDCRQFNTSRGFKEHRSLQLSLPTAQRILPAIRDRRCDGSIRCAGRVDLARDRTEKGLASGFRLHRHRRLSIRKTSQHRSRQRMKG